MFIEPQKVKKKYIKIYTYKQKTDYNVSRLGQQKPHVLVRTEYLFMAK